MALLEGMTRCSNCGRETRVSNAHSPTWPWMERFVRGVLDGKYEMMCPCCNATDEAARSEADREEERAARRAGWMERSGIPAKWRGVAWEEVEADARRADAIRVARRWADGSSKRRGLMLHGPIGRGKSHIAAAAARERLERMPVRWLNVARIIQDLRMPFSSREYQAAHRLLQHGGRAALVLDDLDKLPPSEQSVQVLYLAVNEWVEQNRWVIITSNKDPDGIADDFGPRFGAAIAGRLVEHCTIYPVGGRDRRTNPDG